MWPAESLPTLPWPHWVTAWFSCLHRGVLNHLRHPILPLWLQKGMSLPGAVSYLPAPCRSFMLQDIPNSTRHVALLSCSSLTTPGGSNMQLTHRNLHTDTLKLWSWTAPENNWKWGMDLDLGASIWSNHLGTSLHSWETKMFWLILTLEISISIFSKEACKYKQNRNRGEKSSICQLTVQTKTSDCLLM